MRYTILLIGTAFLALTAQGANADEFGDRFYSQAPKGLGEYTAPTTEIPEIVMDETAEELQDVMPAAGEEEETTTNETEAQDTEE